MSNLFMKSFEKAFEPSSLAASLEGPKQGIPTNQGTKINSRISLKSGQNETMGLELTRFESSVYALDKWELRAHDHQLHLIGHGKVTQLAHLAGSN